MRFNLKKKKKKNGKKEMNRKNLLACFTQPLFLCGRKILNSTQR